MPLTTSRAIVSIAFLWLSHSTLAENHSCPDDRPYQRGSTACDSCPWEQTLTQYRTGKLSTARSSTVFSHSIRVSVVCDTNRTVDVNDVFEKIEATERLVANMFESVIDRTDGVDVILEVITGICDYGGGIDDCNMYTICTDKGLGCDVSAGQGFANVSGEATHLAFVPFLPKDKWWWSPENRYANLQHEFTHLLDYTYFRKRSKRGPNTHWWVEGLAQYVQWKLLENDTLSWHRGNDNATLLDVFTYQDNQSDYYDGMRVFSYLDRSAPWLLEAVAYEITSDVYSHTDLHLSWQNLLGYIALRHQWAYNQYINEVSRNIQAMPRETEAAGRIDDR